MPIVYYDKALLRQADTTHPALEVNETHPCYRMIREAIDTKSVFHLNREQAYAMFKWYHEGWKITDIQDEFGETVPDYQFKEILANSYYLVPDPKAKGVNRKLIPSDETIQQLRDAIIMEKQLLESIGEDKDDDT